MPGRRITSTALEISDGGLLSRTPQAPCLDKRDVNGQRAGQVNSTGGPSEHDAGDHPRHTHVGIGPWSCHRPSNTGRLDPNDAGRRGGVAARLSRDVIGSGDVCAVTHDGLPRKYQVNVSVSPGVLFLGSRTEKRTENACSPTERSWSWPKGPGREKKRRSEGWRAISDPLFAGGHWS